MDTQFADRDVLNGGFPSTELMSMYQQVMKDIMAGHPVPGYTGGGALGPLMLQDISGTLSVAGYKTKHIKFWPRVQKAPDKLHNTVHEFTRQRDYGDDLPFYTAEGGIGPRVDVSIERLFAKCRFMSHIRRVSHAAGLINPIIGPAKDAVEKANWDASRWQLRQLERGLFFGDSTTNPESIDGLKHACEIEGNVYDMQGAAIDTDALYNITVTLIQNKFGDPDAIWMDYTAKQDLAKVFHNYVKYDIQPGVTAANINGGVNAIGLIGPEKLVKFEPNVFLAPDGAPSDTALGADQPATPTIKVQPAATGDAASKFNSDDEGNYYYKVVAFGSTGDNGGVTGCSAPVTSSVVAVTEGDKVALTITKPGSDSVVFYRVYRTKPGGSVYYKVFDVRQSYSEGAVADTVITDYNEYRPDTTTMFVVEHDPEIFIWQQLMGFTRIPFAMTEQTGLKQPFAYVLYGMLEVMVPSKIYMIKNVGREVVTL
jgi:hypothetical protein